MSRSVSIVVNTLNRAESLEKLLEALRQLDYDNFEVVVVTGPCEDGTGTLLKRWASRVKVVDCPERNLSISRNLGVAHAAGELVAFIDDDAYPDPTWLARLERSFDDPEVAAAGGPVFDHTGFDLQALYNLATPMGDSRIVFEGVNPTPYLNFPDTSEFPYPIGTNSIFRRDRLVEIGGFDEEFDYYLDEVDVCYRLIRRGHVVAAVGDAHVYHKFLASDVRTADRAISNRFSVIKNRLYFALTHGLGRHSFSEVTASAGDFVERSRLDFRWCVENGLLTSADLERFELDVHRAFDAALAAHRRMEPRTRAAEWFDAAAGELLPFTTLRPPQRRMHLCFLSQEYPPTPVNGIARVIHRLATGLAARGHVVRVLSAGRARTLVDLEEGVWVHRVAVGAHPVPSHIEAPQHLWNYSASMLAELKRIDAQWPVDLVEGPNWDSELAAVIADGRFRTVLGIYTPLEVAGKIDPGLLGDRRTLDAMIELENFCRRNASALRVSGPGVLDALGQSGKAAHHQPIGFVHHGLPDASVHVEKDATKGVNVLFVGRLEKRKGIDTLLECIPGLIADHPGLTFTLAGNDLLPGEGGVTYRRRFEQGAGGSLPSGAVTFAGLVPDAELQRLYASCDVFAAPSRFESFGLILVEAMIHSKPVVGGDNPGMRMIVEEGGNGYLVPPGDAGALAETISRLVRSPELREAFGKRSRQIYEQRFSVGQMVASCAAFYSGLLEKEGVPAGERSPSSRAGEI